MESEKLSSLQQLIIQRAAVQEQVGNGIISYKL